jgi:hypothetical protein
LDGWFKVKKAMAEEEWKLSVAGNSRPHSGL